MNFKSRLVLSSLLVAAIVFITLGGSVATAATKTVCPIGCDATTITGGIAAASNGDTITVAAGMYNEDVTVNKSVTILGAGIGISIVSGPSGGSGSTFAVTTLGVVIDGFTITRDGNAVATWNDPLNSVGVSIQGSSSAEVRNCYFTGNRTGIDINNNGTNVSFIHNNVIDFNRTGMILRNQTDNLSVVENQITNNWTVGVLFLDGSGVGTPPQTALGSIFSNNNISGNWYGGAVDRQSGGTIPVPGTTNLKNFSGNWWGTTALVVTTANSAEPGYAAQIPVAYGGSAVPPGGQPDIAGPASANIDYTPFLESGTDTNVETTPGRGTIGFQGDFSAITVTTLGAQTGTDSRLQEGVNLVTTGGTVHALAGLYGLSTAVQINKSMTLAGPYVGVSPNDGVTPVNPNAARLLANEATIAVTGLNQAIRIGAADVTVDGFRFTDPGATIGFTGDTLIGAGGNFGGTAPGVAILNNLFDAITRVGVTFNGPTAMDGGTVEDNRVAYPTRATGCGVGPLAISACGRQLFNLWETDHLSFQRNVVVANPANGDRVRVLNVNFPNGPSLQSDPPATNITIAHNTIRYACVFTCITIAVGVTNTVVEENDVIIDVGNILQFHPTFLAGKVTATHNVFTDTGDLAVVIDNPTANISQIAVNRNSLTGGGFRNANTAAVDGTCNWWGFATGPIPAQNAAGMVPPPGPWGPVTTTPYLLSSNLDGSCASAAANVEPSDAFGDEGDTLMASGSFTGTNVVITYAPPVGTLVDNGDGTWSWSYLTNDDVPLTTITVTATDVYGAMATQMFDIQALNVAPTADFNAPNTVTENDQFTISLTNPFDPSSVDTTAGFMYAFDCGSGSFSAFSSVTSATCTSPPGPTTITVRGQIMDKDPDCLAAPSREALELCKLNSATKVDSTARVDGTTTYTKIINVVDAAAPTGVDLSFIRGIGLDAGSLIVWETAAEVDALGFNVYRAAAPDGPFVLVNPRLIAAKGSASGGASYVLRDAPGAGTFLYRLEDVDSAGKRGGHPAVMVQVGPDSTGGRVFLPSASWSR